MYSRARRACHAARPPGLTMHCAADTLAPIASDPLPRSVDASLRHCQAISRFDSNNAMARITRCPSRAGVVATELAEEFGLHGMIGRGLSRRMLITGAGVSEQEHQSFSLRGTSDTRADPFAAAVRSLRRARLARISAWALST
jgi:hypothetical protein